MGRPINKKFFGNKNFPYQDQAVGGPTGDGGEGVNTITVSNTGTAYSAGTVVTINAPQIAGGVPATISYSRTAAGNLSVTKVTAGSGYTSAALTVTKALTVTGRSGDTTNTAYTLTNVSSVAGVYIGMLAGSNYGMQASTYVTAIGTDTVSLSKPLTATTASAVLSFTDSGSTFASSVALTTTVTNALAFTSFLLAKDGGASAVAGGDIMKQESSRRYLVNNSQGRGQVKLVAKNTLVAGQMNLIATDFGGSTYFVTKLTAHKATLVNQYGTGTALVTLTTDADGVKTGATGWTLGSATSTTVTIASV